MGTVDLASMALPLVAVVSCVVAWIVIYSRKRRQAQNARRKPRREVEDESRPEEEELQKAEEERKRVEEEAWRKAEEECRREQQEARTRAEEDERKWLEEERRQLEEDSRKAEEERQKVEEEHKRLEDESRLGAEEAKRKGEVESRRLEPEKRGGRPRAPIQAGEKQPPQGTKSRRLKPEIVCWKRERQWILAVEVPDKILGSSGLVVHQNVLPLKQDESNEGCWPLEQATGRVEVRWSENEVYEKTEMALGKESYLLFKLSGRNRGRRVKFPSLGSYLVIVPDNWERDEEKSGPPPVAPEPVSIVGYQGHYFDLVKGSDKRIAFQKPEGTPVAINPNIARFYLVGLQLIDASEGNGPLFGEKPPTIHALDQQMWKDVRTIVVGEEGTRKGRWRMALSPKQGLIKQDLPAKVAARRGGWYFLRFYDANDDLVESLDFRFVDLLKRIKVRQPPPLPPEGGHAAVSVELLHEPDCSIQPVDSPSVESLVKIHHEDDSTVLTIPPDSTWDKTRWLVGPQGGPEVEVAIQVERLWWALAGEDESPSEWKDTRFTLSRDHFVATANKAIWIRLPRPRWIDTVSIGFEQNKSRRYPVKVTESTVAIPLRDFSDSKEVADRTGEHLLIVWIKCDDGIVGEAIAIIPAELPSSVGQKSSKSEGQQVNLERPLLNVVMISAPRLASVLTRLRRATHGSLRLLIKEVRQQYPGGRRRRRAESLEFVKKALCVIAFSLELVGEKGSGILGLKNRLTARACLARDEFPELMNQLRGRYNQLEAGRANEARHMRDER